MNIESTQNLIYKVVTSNIRRAMLVELKDRDLYPEDLVLIFDLSPSAITKHLKILEQAGFISRHRQGRHILCRLKPQGIMYMKVDWDTKFLV